MLPLSVVAGGRKTEPGRPVHPIQVRTLRFALFRPIRVCPVCSNRTIRGRLAGRNRRCGLAAAIGSGARYRVPVLPPLVPRHVASHPCPIHTVPGDRLKSGYRFLPPSVHAETRKPLRGSRVCLPPLRRRTEAHSGHLRTRKNPRTLSGGFRSFGQACASASATRISSFAAISQIAISPRAAPSSSA